MISRLKIFPLPLVSPAAIWSGVCLLNSAKVKSGKSTVEKKKKLLISFSEL